MGRTKRILTVALLALAMTSQASCAAGQGGRLFTLLLGTAISVGGYFLVQELTD